MTIVRRDGITAVRSTIENAVADGINAVPTENKHALRQRGEEMYHFHWLKNVMKKMFCRRNVVVAICLIAMSISVSAHAQVKGDMAVGGDLVIGMGDDWTNFGIGPKFQYNVTDPIRLEGYFTYFFEKDYLSQWDFSVNAHWLFPIDKQITVYPLAGLGLLGSTVEIPSYTIPYYGTVGGGSESDTDFGINIGGGADYQLTDKLVLNGELKFKIAGDWDRFMISAGLAYKLGK